LFRTQAWTTKRKRGWFPGVLGAKELTSSPVQG
jgi:hypothetical protein